MGFSWDLFCQSPNARMNHQLREQSCCFQSGLTHLHHCPISLLPVLMPCRLVVAKVEFKKKMKINFKKKSKSERGQIDTSLLHHRDGKVNHGILFYSPEYDEVYLIRREYTYCICCYCLSYVYQITALRLVTILIPKPSRNSNISRVYCI